MEWDLGTLISVTDGKLMTSIDNLYKFYEWYSGAAVWTHQLPRLYKQSKDAIIAEWPFLGQLDLDGVDQDNWKQRLDELIVEHGNVFEVSRPLVDACLQREPLGELVDLVGKDKVIAVVTDD